MIPITTRSTALLFSTVRVCAKGKDGIESVGTAFFFDFKVDEQKSLPTLVTNRHVVRGFESVTFLVHAGEKDADGKLTPGDSSIPVTLGGLEDVWTDHPGDVDLCAMPFQPLRHQAEKMGRSIFCVPLVEKVLPNAEALESLSALEQVLMIGYPIGLWDEKNNLPLLRRGHTSSHPAIDFNGQPVGLVDMACFPGSSGSPVLIFNEGSFATPQGMTIGSRLILLGVLFAGPRFTADGSITIADIPTTAQPVARTSIPVHLGYYVKASELLPLKKQLFDRLGVKA